MKKKKCNYNDKIKNNYKNKTHEIKIDSENAEILLSLLKKNNIMYFINDQINNIIVINIDGKDVDKIFDELINEMCCNGMDKNIGCLNEYGKKVDNIAGSFSIIKYN